MPLTPNELDAPALAPGQTAAPKAPRFLQLFHEDTSAVRDELVRGLQATPASASPKFFYDPLGSMLFEAITELPEYYPTRTEAAILRSNAEAIAATVGRVDTMVDLGAGNCAKAASTFGWLRPRRYVAVDISVGFLRDTLHRLQAAHPSIAMTGLGIDFSQSLELPAGTIEGRPLFFYPGSSIGNFAPDAALRLLRQVRERANGGGLLIGVDLVKPVELLEAAYDDAVGVTAAFNLNLLRHVNRLIGADFDPHDWRHRAFFNGELSRIEMHLEARRDVDVRWSGGARRFGAGERIHTENSYKHTPAGFAAILRGAGFGRTTTWTDPRGWFAIVHADAG